MPMTLSQIRALVHSLACHMQPNGDVLFSRFPENHQPKRHGGVGCIHTATVMAQGAVYLSLSWPPRATPADKAAICTLLGTVAEFARHMSLSHRGKDDGKTLRHPYH